MYDILQKEEEGCMEETTLERFLEVLRKFDNAVLATVDDKGRIHARPMAIFELEDDGSVLFITDESSAKVHEIESEPHATVICQKGWNSTVTLSGIASLFRDPDRVRQNWKKEYEAWFPDGPADPRIVLVRVNAEQGEYWDNSGLRAFRYLTQAAKAAITGNRPDLDREDQHAKVSLN
jgi:general stress protein 26